MDPASRLEAIIRLQAVTVAAERDDDVLVCEQGEAYLAEPDPHLDLVTARPNVHVMVAEAWDRLEHPALAAEHYRQALLGAAHLQRPVGEVRARAVLACAKVGDYETLDVVLPAALEHEDQPHRRALLLRVHAVVTFRRTGDLGEATSLLEAAAGAAGHEGTGDPWCHDGIDRGQQLLEAGRPDEAYRVLAHRLGRLRHGLDTDATSSPSARTDLAMTLAATARAGVATGRLDEARALLDEAAALLDRRCTWAHVHDLLARAELAAATADDDAHDRCWRGAVELAEERELLPALVSAWEIRARALDARGDRVGADEALDRAVVLADALGHVADLRRLARYAAERP